MRATRVIDTHAHLDALEDAGRGASRAHAAAGVTRVITIGTGIASCRAALAIADGERRRLRGARDRPAPGGRRGGAPRRRAARAARQPKAVAVGEAGLDYHYGARDEATSSAGSSRRQLALARELGLPVVIHTREANDDTAAMLGGHRRHASSCTASPSRGCSPAALERGWYFSFAGNVTYPQGRRSCARPRRGFPPTGSSPRRTARTSRRSRCAGRPNEPAHVVHTVAALADARGEDADELAARIDANATAAFSLPARDGRSRRSGSASTSSPTATSSA